MIYLLDLSASAKIDVERIKCSGDVGSYKKLLQILAELKLHPKTGTGRPEQLKHGMSGKWARKISKKHRLIYSIDDRTVTVYVFQAYGHYDDK